MSERTSIFTQAPQAVVKRRNQLKEEVAKANPAPLGEERVPLHAAWLRWKGWGRVQREEFVAKKGLAEAMRIVEHGVALEEKSSFGAALRLVEQPKGFGDTLEEL